MKTPEPRGCYFDPKLKIKIHWFPMGQDTCECGNEKVAGPRYRGWGQDQKKKKT